MNVITIELGQEMVMTYRGKVENGVVVLERAVGLPDGTVVDVEVEPVEDKAPPTVDEGEIPTLYERYKSIIGILKDAPADLSANHDHYAHGAPKGIDEK